jgi:hypothetical protein
MPSMMDHIADFQRGGAELRRLGRIYERPDFIKVAKVIEDDGSVSVHFTVPAGAENTYADKVRKQFPCHTKIATWLSALFYQEKRAEFHPKDRAQIEKNLDYYASYWLIKPAYDALKARADDLEKKADSFLPDSAYMYVWVNEDGSKDRRLPLRSAAEVKAAADYLFEYRDRFDFPARHAMARKVLEKASHYGAAVTNRIEFLEKQAGRGVCDPKEVALEIEKRALLVPADAGVTHDEDGKPSEGLRERFRKMAATIADTPSQHLHPDRLVKLATTIDQLDRQLGLVPRYGQGLTRPEDVVFSATFAKAAAELTARVATTTGTVYEKAAFGRLALSDVKALFGDEFAGRIGTPLGDVDAEKMAEEVATLPRPDAQLLDNLLSDSGISPVLRKSGSDRQGVTKEEFEAIAAQYAGV